MSDNIDIRVREDGSRVVSRSLDELAAKADKAGAAVETMNKRIESSSGNGTALTKLQNLIKLAESYGAGMVRQIDQTTSHYRTSLMKHFEMVSKEARASAASIKSSMEAITASPVNMDAMNAYYRKQEALDKQYTAFLANELAIREAEQAKLDAALVSSTMKSLVAKTAADQEYTAMWSSLLASRDKAEQDALVTSVRNLETQEEAERKSSADRLKISSQIIATKMKDEAKYTSWWASELAKRDQQLLASAKLIETQQAAENKSSADRLKAATQVVSARMKAESEYTVWWSAELAKRDSAQAASALRNAEQRSKMQAFNPSRLNSMIAPAQGTSELSKFYAAQSSGNIGGKTALQTAEVQAMQRQMAMYQLLAPMAQKQLELDRSEERRIGKECRL